MKRSKDQNHNSPSLGNPWRRGWLRRGMERWILYGSLCSALAGWRWRKSGVVQCLFGPDEQRRVDGDHRAGGREMLFILYGYMVIYCVVCCRVGDRECGRCGSGSVAGDGVVEREKRERERGRERAGVRKEEKEKAGRRESGRLSMLPRTVPSTSTGHGHTTTVIIHLVYNIHCNTYY